VQLRPLDQLVGIGAMRRRRDRAATGWRRSPQAAIATHDLCRGPGNLTMAMGITLAENRLDLLGERLYIENRGVEVGDIAWGPRVGIRVGTEAPWRAWVRK